MLRPALALFACIASLGCSRTSDKLAPAATAEPLNGAKAKPHACEAKEGSPLDVAHEPDWRKHAEYVPWTDRQGCLVRIDVLAERPGPSHCNYQDTRVIIIGTPFGAPYTKPDDTQTYVRDPNGVYKDPGIVAGFVGMTGLPNTALDSGYRKGDIEFWYDPQDPTGIFLREGRRVERWPRGTVPPCQ